ncbi:MAG: PAS-domain containing protein [Alphaproteobacteria bacterium]|nr:PAS-domain containing protein [Alphaproteobacteria bacterium]
MTGAPSRTMATFIGAMLVILGVIIAAGIAGIMTIDVIRSYASGSMHYTKSHLGATGALRQFVQFGTEEDFLQYRYRLYVAVSDRIAREILEEPDLDRANSYSFLIGGKIHPEDAPGIAWMFRAFEDTALFAPAIEIWRAADREIERLDAFADQVHQDMRAGPLNRDQRDALLREIDAFDRRLIELEDRFAWQLSDVARTVTKIMFWSLGMLAAALAALVVVLGYRMQARLDQAQRAIQDREQRFRDIAEVAGDWIWETDEQQRFSYFSPRLEQVLGIPTTALLGKTRQEVANIEDTPAWRQYVADVEARRPFQNFEYVFRHPDGRVRHMRLNAKPVFDDKGGFHGYRGTGTDITIQVLARREVQEKQALLQTTFEHMAQGIIVFDSDLRVVEFNQRFLDLLRFPSGMFKPGDPLDRFVHYRAKRGDYGDGDSKAHVAARIAQARRFEPRAFEFIHIGGSVLEIHGRPLPDGGFVTTYTDVAERHHAERELTTAKDAAEAANRAKSAFMATMSHELRTPLNVIIGFADLLVDALSSPHDEYARDIRRGGEHLLEIINDILDLTRIEAGKIDLTMELVDTHALVERCLHLLKNHALEAGVTIKNEVPNGTAPIRADHQRLRQIMLNLVGNAIKFSEAGTAVSVRYVETDDTRGLCVVDQGIGIAPDKIDKTFEPFSQLDSGHTRKHGGVGLGLPLVRRFMELHGGTVSIDSRVGEGTTVTVLFPARIEATSEVVSASL